MTLCQCGCGEETKNGNRFVNYHHNRGIVLTEEHKAKLRYPKSEEQKAKMRHPFTEEHKAKLRHPKSEEGKKNIQIAAQHRRPVTQETRDRWSKSKVGNNNWIGKGNNFHSKEAIEKRIITRRKNGWFKNPEMSINKIKERRLRQVFPFKNTKIEIKMQNELSLREYAYYMHYSIIGQPDIAFPDDKIAIFVDGDNVHGHPNKFKEEDRNCFGDKIVIKWKRDIQVTKTLQSKGWFVLRYWGSEIDANIVGVVDEIEDILLKKRMQK